MDLGLKGKRALVTGASAGLGEAAATALAAEGVQLVINSRDSDRLHAAADRIGKATGNKPALAIGDLSQGRDEVVRAARDHLQGGVVDILVSNTGGPPPGSFLEQSADLWDQAGSLLLDSAVGLTRAFLPGMVEQRWGRLIYITSIAVLQPVDALILSNSYRAAVTGFCKTLSNNYARHGVTANCVCPGYTITERLRNLAEHLAEQAGTTGEAILREMAEETSAQRVGRPEELAALITFLAGEPAAYITGVSIPVDGGLHKGLF
jgi:3-oxoacyl-[acyl-carrier protein] reductase